MVKIRCAASVIGIVGTYLSGVFLLGTILPPARAEIAPTARLPKEKHPLFSSLTQQTESAVLDYEMERCFYSPHYRFEYRPLPTPRILVTDMAGGNGRRSGERVGTVLLNRAQVERFDNLLRLLRTNHSDVASIDRAIFVVYRGNTRVYSEYFVNTSGVGEDLADARPEDIEAIRSSCYPGIRADLLMPVLSPWRLAAAAKKSGRTKRPVPYIDMRRQETPAYCHRQLLKIIAEQERHPAHKK